MVPITWYARQWVHSTAQKPLRPHNSESNPRDSRDYTLQDASGPTQEAAFQSRLSIGGGGGGCDAPTGRPASAPSFPGSKSAPSTAMRPDQATSWYRRMSAVYALGAWTLLGSLIFLGRKKSKVPGTVLRQPSVRRPQGVII